MTHTSPWLDVSNVSKHFGGVQAVSEVSLSCGQNEIVGLIGPNGAGKTTLLNLISGVEKVDSGTVVAGGVDLGNTGPRERALAGISRTFQNIRLFAHLTVRENVEVSASVRHKHRPGIHSFSVDELLEMFELTAVWERKAGTLSYGYQRRTEIARALALAPEMLMLDEPAAGLNEMESLELANEIRRVQDLAGCGLLVIDHDLPFIMGLCSRIYVLDKGSLIAQGSPSEVQQDPNVRSVYLGGAAEI